MEASINKELVELTNKCWSLKKKEKVFLQGRVLNSIERIKKEKSVESISEFADRVLDYFIVADGRIQMNVDLKQKVFTEDDFSDKNNNYIPNITNKIELIDKKVYPQAFFDNLNNAHNDMSSYDSIFNSYFYLQGFIGDEFTYKINKLYRKQVH